MNNVVAALGLTAIIVLTVSLFSFYTGNMTGSLRLAGPSDGQQEYSCPACECEECPDAPETQCQESVDPQCTEDTTPYTSCSSCCPECQQCEQCEECPSCPECDSCCPDSPAAGEPEGETDYLFVGSVNSDKYHYPDCVYAQKIKAENQVWFVDENDAKSQGYTPCGSCNPPN